MLVEPLVDREALIDAVHQYYGLAVGSLEFHPVGWASTGYVLRAGDAQYFLKLWTSGREAIDRLPFIQQLHTHGLSVPYPLKTRSQQLSVEIPAGVIALFPFLTGSTPPNWPDWPRPVLEEVGRTIGLLHSIPLDLPYREQFAISTREDLRPYYDGDVLAPYQLDLLHQLARLDELQLMARRSDGPLVVSHTDLIGNNLLVDDEGRVSMLDWDDIRLAPPEQDLAMLLHGVQPVEDTALSIVLDVYPARPLRLEMFAFFLLRRGLEDFAARVVRLHEPGLDAAELADAREGLALWGVDQWRHLDRNLDAVRALLG